MMKTLAGTAPKWTVGTTLYIYVGGVWFSFAISSIDNTTYAPNVFYTGTLTDMSTNASYSDTFNEAVLVANGATTTAPTPVSTTPTSSMTAMFNAMMPMLMMFMMMGMIMPMMTGFGQK